MPGLRRLLIILLIAGWPAQVLTAQDRPPQAWQYRVEIMGTIAAASFYNGDSRWGTGLDYGGGFGIRPFSGWLRRLGFEFQMSRLHTTGEVPWSVSKDLDSRLLMGNVLFHFRSGTRVQPYALAGIGHVEVDYKTQCVNCIYNVDPVTGQLVPVPYGWKVRDSKTGISLGGGLKIDINRHLSIRPELLVVDTTAGTGWNWLWLKSQIGFGVHF
jgi:opacity protein-like surface antigen